MQRKLTRVTAATWYFVNGERVDGLPPSIWGDVTGIRGDVTGIEGDVSGIEGDVSGIWGDVSGIRGDVTGIRGDVTGIWGDVSECKLAKEQREAGVYISDLVVPPSGK